MHKINRQNINFFIIPLILSCFLSWLITGDVRSYTLLGLFFFIRVGIVFIREIGQSIPIREIIAIFTILQCVLAPALAYEAGYEEYMDMAVYPSQYFIVALPCTIAFLIGLYWKKQKFIVNLSVKYANKTAGIILFSVGFLASFVDFGFISYLLSLLKLVGLFYLIFSNSKLKYVALIIYIIYLVYHSLSAVMFNDMLIAFLFIFIYLSIRYKTIRRFKVIIILTGFILILGIQAVKSILRDELWEGSVNKETKNEIIKTTIVSTNINEDVFIRTIYRLNQGWQIAKVIDYVPAKTPYGYGDTYYRTITTMLLPRFLFQNKPKADGKYNMEKYAGVQMDGWSADIGFIGEAYANFGHAGSIMMLLLGLFICWVINFIEKRSILKPDILLWLPLIMFNSVRAGSSSLTCFNHLAKASLLVWFLFSKYFKKLLFIRDLRIGQ